jgi:hypothetical protein
MIKISNFSKINSNSILKLIMYQCTLLFFSSDRAQTLFRSDIHIQHALEKELLSLLLLKKRTAVLPMGLENGSRHCCTCGDVILFFYHRVQCYCGPGRRSAGRESSELTRDGDEFILCPVSYFMYKH